MALEFRKTRFVCVSDTHNASPADGAFKLPKGDVLVHAGDLTKQGTLQELKKTLDWIARADFEVKLVVAGNHDITLDPAFYAEHGPLFHNQRHQDSQECLNLVQSYREINFLNHESADIRLAKDDGPKTSFKVFGSPYSPKKGLWAFGYEDQHFPGTVDGRPQASLMSSIKGGSGLWDKIPLNTDVVITHTPPKGHCDQSGRTAAGCESLYRALWRVRPSLAICGHIHEGRGADRISWDLSTQNPKFQENMTGHWEDPGFDNKKQSLLDLSSKSRNPLRNNGPWEVSLTNSTHGGELQCPLGVPSLPPKASRPRNTEANTEISTDSGFTDAHGQGGSPPSHTCDMEALEGRLGRQETCVINAAIMASSWSPKSSGGRKYNKAIVVDLDLPLWNSEIS